MTNRLLAGLTLALTLSPVAAFANPPTRTQLCTSAVETASAKFAQCRLNAEAKFAKTLDGAKRSSALAKCSSILSIAFTKATITYGAACAVTESAAGFDSYLTQCSDDTTAAAGGASLPDYVGELASCNADLTTCQSDLAICQATLPAPLLKTGQTTSYGSGDDGDLQKGVALNYVDNGDGTITDTKTGLMWEKKSDDATINDKDNTYTWTSTSTAADGTVFTTFLAGLNAGSGFAGHTDWRLPNRRELDSIVNLENVNPAVSAAFNNNCGANSSGNAGCTVTTCSCTVPDFYWSSSTYAFDPQGAWGVFFFDGGNGAGSENFDFFVRAVRGGS